MTSQLRIANEGPDDAFVVFHDQHGKAIHRIKIPAQTEIRLATSHSVSFSPVKPLSAEEIAMANGISVDQLPKRHEPMQYVEDA